MKINKKLIISFALVFGLLIVNNFAYAGKPVAKYVSWLGNIAVAPANPQLYSAYYNTASGASFIFDENGWQEFASKGDTGPQGEPGISPTELSAIEDRLTALEAENKMLKEALGLYAQPSASLSKIDDSGITIEVGEEFHFDVTILDSTYGNPIINLADSDFAISDGTISNVTMGADGQYTIYAAIDSEGSYTLQVTAKDITLDDTLPVNVTAVDEDGIPSTLSSFSDLPSVVQVGNYYSVTINILDEDGNPINNLEMEDFVFDQNVVDYYVTLDSSVSGQYDMQIAFLASGNYSLRLQVNGVWMVGELVVEAIS